MQFIAYQKLVVTRTRIAHNHAGALLFFASGGVKTLALPYFIFGSWFQKHFIRRYLGKAASCAVGFISPLWACLGAHRACRAGCRVCTKLYVIRTCVCTDSMYGYVRIMYGSCTDYVRILYGDFRPSYEPPSSLVRPRYGNTPYVPPSGRALHALSSRFKV